MYVWDWGFGYCCFMFNLLTFVFLSKLILIVSLSAAMLASALRGIVAGDKRLVRAQVSVV